MKEQTAVEWLIEEWVNVEKAYYSGSIGRLDLIEKRAELQNKAKELEKQQIIDFHIEVMKKGLEYENEEKWCEGYLPLIKKRAEQYYNETFKNK
jgi:hypothetical protein